MTDIGSSLRRVAEWLLFGVLPAVVFCWWLAFAIFDPAGDWAFDFWQVWSGGNDVAHGVSPYPDPSQLPTNGDHLDSVDIREIFRLPYPAAAAVAGVPFGLLGFDAAALVWGALMIVSVFAALWILEVRDWRVVGVVVGSAPVIGSIRIGTMTPLLVLLLAAAWRWRDRRWLVGGSLAVAISLKLFLWPLVFWLAATRRWAAAGAATALAAAITFGSWGLIGFAGLTDYPDLLRRLADVVQGRGFSLVALGLELDLREPVAELLPWLVGLSLLVVAAVASRGPDGDRHAFSLAIVAAIALSPIVWLHYFALLVVPLAVARPRLAWTWGLMWVFWLVPAQENEGEIWRVLLGVGVTAAICVACVSGARRTAVDHGVVGASS
jgi:hypothetical protein